MMRARMLRGVAGGALTLTLGLTALSAPAAWASPSVQHPVTYKFAVSKLAWTGSRAVIAATDTHGDLYYFWEASGSAKWHEQVVAKARNGVSYGKPAIAWTGHSVFIAAVNQAGALVYFLPHAGGTWSYHLLSSADLAGRLKWQAPSVTSIPGGGLLMTDGNGGGVLNSWELAPGASQWTELAVAFGTFGASSVTICPNGQHGYLGLVTAAAGGTVYFWWEYLDSPTWRLETIASPVLGVGFTSASITATNSTLLVTAATTNGLFVLWSQPIGGSGWSQQTVTSAGNRSGHPVISWFEMTIRLREFGYDVMAGIGPRGQLGFWWQPAGGSSWYPETIAKAGKQAVYASPSISVSGKAVIVAAVNTKSGNLMFWYQLYGATPWHTQLVAKG
jgi:hypothetical protein